MRVGTCQRACTLVYVPFMPRLEHRKPAAADRLIRNPFTGETSGTLAGRPASTAFVEIERPSATSVSVVWGTRLDDGGAPLFAVQQRVTECASETWALDSFTSALGRWRARGYVESGASREGSSVASHPLDPHGKTGEAFAAELAHVPWLASLGEPSADDDHVVRLASFEAWLGPEDAGSSMLAARLQEFRDALDTTPERPSWDALEDHVSADVTTRASWNVPYEPSEDPWFAPNAAVMQAAWVSRLLVRHLLLDRAMDDELLRIWKWTALGHWPAAYADDGRLVVF